MPKPWKLAGPLNATGRLMYWYVAWNGVVRFVSPQPTSKVANRDVTTPIIARFADDRRVRTLDRARMNAARGAMTISGTAHGRAVEGSNVKPDGRDPEAVPEAAVAIFAAASSRLSERSPVRLFQRQA
jgi:hypothetical protein